MSGWHPGIRADWRNQIITGDARVLAQELPDESVDLIFTDPVYDRIDDYRWLAQMATHLLRRDGNCMAFVNAKHVTRLLREVPSDFPLLSYQRASAICPMNGRLISKTTHLVWWGSGKIIGYIPDGYLSVNWSANHCDPGGHQWTKNPKYLSLMIRNLTTLGAVVFDPFTGHATVPAVCKMLGRNWVAFEIDPATAERARQRVDATPEPLPGIDEPTQLDLMEVQP